MPDCDVAVNKELESVLELSCLGFAYPRKHTLIREKPVSNQNRGSCHIQPILLPRLTLLSGKSESINCGWALCVFTSKAKMKTCTVFVLVAFITMGMEMAYARTPLLQGKGTKGSPT